MNINTYQDYRIVLQHLEAAQKMLKRISEKNQHDYDADSYAAQVAAIISCDDGEAGLKPFIDAVARNAGF